MPLPTASDMHVDRVLTNLSVAYDQEVMPISSMVFPRIPVTRQSDKYFVYDLADWNRPQMELRAPGTESAGAGWRVSNDTYYADVYALHKDIDDQTRNNVDDPLDLERDAVMFLKKQNALKQEYAWASEFFAASKWTGSTTGGDITPSTLWSASNSTPIKDVRAQARSIKLKTGYLPNTMVIGGELWDALCDNADIIDRIKYTARGVITEDMVAPLFRVDRIIVAETMYVTSNEGATTTTTAAMYGKHALLCYVPKGNRTLQTPAAGYTFDWTGQAGSVGGSRVLKFRMDPIKSDRVEIESAWDMKQIGATLGAFFLSAAA